MPVGSTVLWGMDRPSRALARGFLKSSSVSALKENDVHLFEPEADDLQVDRQHQVSQ